MQPASDPADPRAGLAGTEEPAAQTDRQPPRDHATGDTEPPTAGTDWMSPEWDRAALPVASAIRPSPARLYDYYLGGCFL